jgi:two-component system response regulator HydG
MDEKLHIMIVDDEMIVRESFYHWFTKAGHVTETASSGFEALERLNERAYDLLFVDIKMPGMDGLELLEKIKAEYPETMVIIITAYGSIESAVKAMKSGASDYLLKPFKPEQLSLALEKIVQQKKLTAEYNYLKGCLEKMTRFDNIVGQSEAMKKVFKLIPEIAESDASILLTGETGTGKELVAKAIHAKSRRSQRPFVAINCGAIPDSLLESELFGHQKGVFTGASQARKGFLEVVSGGTLFLDEIGDISPKMQIDLLRVLEDKTITRLGSRDPTAVDFRLISATRHDLDEAVRAGRFREDFFYRINVIQIHIPPLRERKSDIPLLIQHFLKKYSHETAKRVDRVSNDTLDVLKGYNWPGNVRELENAVERAVVLSRSRTLRAGDFAFVQSKPVSSKNAPTLKEIENNYITQVLEENNWNITKASGVLGINRVTLHKKIKRLELKREAPAVAANK